MTRWTALNVAYEDWVDPSFDLRLSSVDAHDHDGTGFDVLLDVYQVDRDDDMYVTDWLVDRATQQGAVERLVRVIADDTTMHFRVTQLDGSGNVIETFYRPSGDFSSTNKLPLGEWMDHIYDKHGFRPHIGGNFPDA